MPKKLPISVDAEVYDDLARPLVIGQDLAAGYAATAADEAREAKAEAWSEGLIADVAGEPGHRER